VDGPATAVDRVTIALDQRLPGGFTITKVSDVADAERLIRDRKVDGAIDVTTGGPQVFIASGGSPAVAQTLQSVAAGLRPRPGNGSPVAVHDIAALPSDDPRGAGLAAGSLPLVLGGMIAAVLFTRLVRGRLRRTVGAFVSSYHPERACISCAPPHTSTATASVTPSSSCSRGSLSVPS